MDNLYQRPPVCPLTWFQKGPIHIDVPGFNYKGALLAPGGLDEELHYVYTGLFNRSLKCVGYIFAVVSSYLFRLVQGAAVIQGQQRKERAGKEQWR